MARLGSGKTQSKIFPGMFDVKLGTYNAFLVGLQLYHSDKWQSSEVELNLGFILDIEDPDAEHDAQENGLYRHTESFVRLQYDDEGNFGPGGAKAKAYKLISAFYGGDFNSFSDDFEWYFDFLDDVDFVGIQDVPHYKSYKDDEEWLRLADIFLKPDGKEERGIMGNKAMVKFGYAQKPNGDYSDKITIVEAMALPASQRTGGKTEKAAKPAAKPAKAEKPAPAPELEPEPETAPVQTGASTVPKYVSKVREWARKLGVADEDFKAWFEYFTDQEIISADSFSKEQAKFFKTAYDNDSDQIVKSYQQYKEFIQPSQEIQEEDDGFWDDDEEAA